MTETNRVCKVIKYSFDVILALQCMIHVMLSPWINILYFFEVS